MNIYLDTNVYCRPFDNQEQLRIRDETDAFEKILDRVRSGDFLMLTSDILQYEISNIFAQRKRSEVERYLLLCKSMIAESDTILRLGIRIRDRCGIQSRDALHLAAAIEGRASYFLTCDDDVTSVSKSTKCAEKIAAEYGCNIKICNPIDFINSEA